MGKLPRCVHAGRACGPTAQTDRYHEATRPMADRPQHRPDLLRSASGRRARLCREHGSSNTESGCAGFRGASSSETANTSSPLCMPARASLITGQHVNEHGGVGQSIRGRSSGTESREEHPHRRVLHRRGRQDAFSGTPGRRWAHARPCVRIACVGDTSSPTRPRRTPSPRATHRCYYADFLARQGKLQVYEDCARVFRRGQNGGVPAPLGTRAQPPRRGRAHRHVHSPTGRRTGYRGYADDRPFYLQVCLMDRIRLSTRPARFRDMFEPQEMPPGDPAGARGTRFAPGAEDVLAQRTCRHDRIPEPDHDQPLLTPRSRSTTNAIGIVLRSLEEKGLMDNTWIVYTSDHGEMLGDHLLCQKSPVL